MRRHHVKQEHRLRRQFHAFSRIAPVSRAALDRLTSARMRPLRAPLAGLLILSGVFSFLPVLGIWMLPLGLMLLAVDVPALRPRVSAAVIRSRRRFSLFRRRWSF